jgi:hypothetical protein
MERAKSSAASCSAEAFRSWKIWKIATRIRAMNKGKLNYDEPRKLPRETVQVLLSSERTDDVEKALVSLVLHDMDSNFVLEQLFKHAKSQCAGIRGTAILCLGHAARIHRSLPIEPTAGIVKAGLADADEYVRGQAHSAAEDIDMFVPDVGRRVRE